MLMKNVSTCREAYHTLYCQPSTMSDKHLLRNTRGCLAPTIYFLQFYCLLLLASIFQRKDNAKRFQDKPIFLMPLHCYKGKQGFQQTGSLCIDIDFTLESLPMPP